MAPETPNPTEISLHRKSRVLEVAFDDGSPVMHQSMRCPRPRNASAILRTPSTASPSSSEVSSRATVPG